MTFVSFQFFYELNWNDIIHDVKQEYSNQEQQGVYYLNELHINDA